ncbi:MAG: hypothetical protein DHS20C05_19920 [Hyphococcus sp.]|nr:MAG: hypothetical protein DHS20C05_19920 [Marinicaulis sp.]
MLFSRFGVLLIVGYFVGGLVLISFLLEAENEKPWLVAMGLWVVGFLLAAYWWRIDGSRNWRSWYNKETGEWEKRND